MPAAQATKPVAQAVTTAVMPAAQATKPAAQAVTTAVMPVAQATKPAAQAITTAVKPATQATKPATQAVATATKPAAQMAIPAAHAVTVTNPSPQSANPAAQAVPTATDLVAQAAALTAATPGTTVVTTAVPAPSVQHADTTSAAGLYGALAAQTAANQAEVAGSQAWEFSGASPNVASIEVRASGANRAPAMGGGAPRNRATPVGRVTASLRPATAASALTFGPRRIAESAAAARAASASSSNDDSANDAIGLAVLLGAGGAALLRLRQSAVAAGLTDAGTLTALGQSASVFWAGSCYSLGSTSASVSMTSSLGASAGDRAQFAVAGVVSDASSALGGRASSASATIARAPGNDLTGLVVLLFAASAAIGAAFGAIVPNHEETWD
jgi:hypothetical protein